MGLTIEEKLEKKRAAQRRYYQKNRENILAVRALCRGTAIQGSEVPADLVEAQKLVLKVKRLIAEKRRAARCG